AAVGIEALRLPVGPGLGPVALAVAEGVELAGPAAGHAAVGQRGAVHALQAVSAVEVLGAGLVAHLLRQLALAAGQERDRRQEDRQPHWNTSRRTAARLAGSSTEYVRRLLSIRRTRPARTLPGPISITVSTPFRAIF